MAISLKDGTGKGYEVQIASDGRMSTRAVSETSLHANSVEDAQVYSVGTSGFIAINTLNTETGCLYIKNTSTSKRFMLHSVRTCGNQVQKVKMYKNPTTGTLISNAVAGHKVNLNFSSSNTPDLTVYKGADTYTITDGTLIGQHINNVGHSIEATADALIIGPNDSLGLTFELAASGVVCANLEGFFEVI